MGALQQVDNADQAEYTGDQRDRPQPFMLDKGEAGEGENDAHSKEGVAA